MSTIKVLVPAIHVHAVDFSFPLHTLKLWNRRYRTRKQLSELSPHMLKDIGLSTYDAEVEARKPFWKD